MVKEVRCALDHNLYFAALTLALTLPDVCAKAEFPELKSSKERYVKWFDENIGKYERSPSADPEMPYISGKLVYNLRCQIVHSGDPNLDFDKYNNDNKYSIEEFALVLQADTGFFPSGGETSGIRCWGGKKIHRIQINVRRLCLIICLVVEGYYEENRDKFNFSDFEIIDWDEQMKGRPEIDLGIYIDALRNNGDNDDETGTTD